MLLMISMHLERVNDESKTHIFKPVFQVYFRLKSLIYC